MPLWIVLSFALRDMSGMFPNKIPLHPEATASFASEGLLWFHNLTLPDPFCILPVVLALSNFLNIEVECMCVNECRPYSSCLIPFPVMFRTVASCHQTSISNKSTTYLDKCVQNCYSWNGLCCISATCCKSHASYCANKESNVIMQVMSLYWSVSSSYGLAQNVLFRLPRVRRALAIPKTPSESKHPYKDLLAVVKQKSKDFIRLQRR